MEYRSDQYVYKFPVEWIPVGGSSKADEKCRRHSTSVLFISFYPQSSSILLIPVFIVIKVHLMAKLTDKNGRFSACCQAPFYP
jgi:hypothetical protein